MKLKSQLPNSWRALVIGGTGFIGLNIAQALRDRGHDVRITRRESSLTFLPRKLKIPMVTASLDDVSSLSRAMRGCDVVFLSAAHYPRYSLEVEKHVAYGVEGVKNAMIAAKEAGISKLIYTSSIATIGPSPTGGPSTEADQWPQAPDSVYHAIKLAEEREVLQGVENGVPAVILCPGGCLGQYDLKAATGFFIVSLAQNALPYLVHGMVNVVSVHDIAAAHLEAVLRGRVGQRYILGGADVDAARLIKMTARYLGVSPPQTIVPLQIARERNLKLEEEANKKGRGRPDIPVEFLDLMRFEQRFDSSLAKKEFGFCASPLDETLAKAVTWFKQAGYLKQPHKKKKSMESSG